MEEFAQEGDEVTLIFDGAGTRWAAELVKEENNLHGAFAKVQDKVAGACHYCAGAFEVREELAGRGIPLLREHNGHPSVRGLVADGYEVITFRFSRLSPSPGLSSRTAARGDMSHPPRSLKVPGLSVQRSLV